MIEACESNGTWSGSAHCIRWETFIIRIIVIYKFHSQWQTSALWPFTVVMLDTWTLKGRNCGTGVTCTGMHGSCKTCQLRYYRDYWNWMSSIKLILKQLSVQTSLCTQYIHVAESQLQSWLYIVHACRSTWRNCYYTQSCYIRRLYSVGRWNNEN